MIGNTDKMELLTFKCLIMFSWFLNTQQHQVGVKSSRVRTKH